MNALITSNQHVTEGPCQGKKAKKKEIKVIKIGKEKDKLVLSADDLIVCIKILRNPKIEYENE